MLACVDAGDFDVIVARHMDRLLRRLAEFESVLERCTATKTAIVTAADGVVSGAGPGGRPLGCAGVMGPAECEVHGDDGSALEGAAAARHSEDDSLLFSVERLAGCRQGVGGRLAP